MRTITYCFGLLTILLCLKHNQTVPVSPSPTLEDGALNKKLKVLSKLGEKYVEEEVKKALMGVNQMKKTMEMNGEKHENILKSLKKTKEEKEEAVRLFQDISEKLSEVKMQCKQLLKAQWDECGVCLERSCITCYTSSCSQQGLQTSIIKDHNLFSGKWPPLNLNTQSIEEKYINGSYLADEVSKAENMFSKLMSDVGLIFNQSIGFFTVYIKEFDESFQKLFLSEVKLPEMTITLPGREPVIISDYFEHWEFSNLVQGLYEFGQSAFEAMNGFLVTMFKKLSNDSKDLFEQMQEVPNQKITARNANCNQLRNAAECLVYQAKCQLCFETLTEGCPDMMELHLKSESALTLVNVSAQQYEDVVHLSQQHTDDMFYLVSQMKEEYGWLAEHSNTTGTKSLFSIDKVLSTPNTEDQNIYDTVVAVKIFSSPNVIRLPANIDIDSQEFIPYIAHKALDNYKHEN